MHDITFTTSVYLATVGLPEHSETLAEHTALHKFEMQLLTHIVYTTENPLEMVLHLIQIQSI